MEPDVRITFRFLRDPDGVAPVIRLRQLLKYAKRAQFMKALFPIEDLPTEQENENESRANCRKG